MKGNGKRGKNSKNCLSVVLTVIIVSSVMLGIIAADTPINNTENTTTEIILDYSFERPIIESGFQEPYKLIKIPGLSTHAPPGEPVIPFKTVKILIPDGEEVSDIEVIPGDKVYLGKFFIQPGQEAVPLSYTGQITPTLPNSTIYASTKPYPEDIYSKIGVQWKRGYQILVLNLYPVEYIPKSMDLSYFERFKVIVRTKQVEIREERLYRGLPQDGELIPTMVDNPVEAGTYDSEVKLQISSPLLPGQFDYVIITNEELKNAPGPYNFQALADWKNSKGISTAIVTIEDIYANYSGLDNQTKIRNFIKDAYLNNGIEYVLLGGDADGADVGGESGDNIVPVRGLWACSWECDPPNIPSDLYYACLDGSYDYDGDGVYGEPNDGPAGGEVDLMAEVYIGRAPVDSASELSNFIMKTISHENTSINDPYLRDVWMVGERLGFGGVADWGGNFKDEIKDGSCNHDYCTAGFPDIYNMSTLYDRDYSGNDWHKSEIINIINNNTHIINHLGHARIGNIMKMYNDDVDALTNNKFFFGYSQGCYAGSFDNRDTDPFCQFQSYDCVVEHLVTNPTGAFGFIANSRYGWGEHYSTNSPSQRYDRQFWEAIFGEDIVNVGKANQNSKEDNIGLISDGKMRFCYYEINLLGDPETPILGVGRKGVVYLDKKIYNCSSILNVMVKDVDLNADNTTVEKANVSIMSFATETIPENITLTETGVDTAIFKGLMSLTTSSPVPDGHLSVADGDLIIVFYKDEDDGTGNLATVFDTATVDCVAPIITVTTPQNNTTYNSNSVALNYSVNERTDWEGYRLDGQPIVIISGNPILTNLTDGGHNVTIYASDIAGNVGASDKIWFNITTPDIWVISGWINPIILPQGNITNGTLTIGNNGTGMLEFEISGVGTGTGSVLVDDEHGNTPHNAFYNDLVSQGFTVDHTTSKITPNLLSGYDAFITVQASYSYSTDEITAIQNFVSSGGGLFVIGDDDPYIYEQLTGYAGISWSSDSGSSGYTTTIYPHAITEGISELYFGAPIASLIVSSPAQEVVLDDIGSTIQVAASEYGTGKIVALVDEHCLCDEYINDSDNRLFGRNVINWVCAGASWLNVTPPNGTICSSNQTNITVTFNATDLDVDKYNATIVIASNDPDENPVKVPVRLIVTQLYPPDIWVEPKSFDVPLEQGEVKYENLTIGNNGTGNLLFNITDTVTGQFFSDDMESGVDRWTHGGSYDEWELGTPTYGPSNAHSGTNCWGTDLDSQYDNYCDQWLMSPLIDLSNARNVNLSFYRWYRTESCDIGYVEISTNNGITWTQLTSYRGTETTWTQENIDISGYAGNSSVRIRFRLTSDGSITYAGLYIDDVIVSGEDATDWLSVTPTSGTVPPKNQTNLTVEINTTSLEVGEYNATIIITHNDILHDTINVPVNLMVFSAPHDIAVTDITAPNSTEINSTIVIDSTISNFGLKDESNITVDFIVDGVNQSSSIIIPSLASFASTSINFTWTAPGTLGIYNLTIYAEPVPDENITWNNQLSKNISVITIPDIWGCPEEFNLTLKRGEVVNRTLTIGNNGTGILNASLSTSLPTDIYLDNEQEIIVRSYSYGYTYVVNNSNLDTTSGWEWRSPYTDSYKGFAIADVNGDGTPNLLEGGNNYLRVYDVMNNGVLYNIPISGSSHGGTASGDIDNDGIVEMLVSDYNGYIYVYDGTTGLPDAQGHITSTTPSYGTGLGIGDIDNDGVVEVIRADRYGIDIFNGKTRALEGAISIPSLYGYPDIVFGDANGNDIAEIYVGGEYGYVYAYEWNGVTATRLWQSLYLGSDTRPCGFADADNDGDFEVFVGDSSGYLYALDASTGFREGSVYTGYSSYTYCTIGDIDNDGTLEIATGNRDGYIRTYTYDSGVFTLEKKSVTDYGSDLGRYTDSMIISGAKDQRVFREVSFIRFNKTEVSVPPYNNTCNVTVTFNATNLNKGTYTATILINSNDPDESLVSIPVNLRVTTPPHIISFSSTNLTPTQYVGTTNTFSVITDQVMRVNEWYLLPEEITTLGNVTASFTVTWDHEGVYNITYIGSNENGRVNITWIVTVSEHQLLHPFILLTKKISAF